MKRKFLTLALALLVCAVAFAQKLPVMHYTIDMTQSTDTFAITLNLQESLSKSNNLFQFAATAPGTYQTMNIGRFVSDFKAFDKKGRPLDVQKINVNQYQLSKPQKLKRITYRVAETWDTEVKEFPVYPMAGSSLEKDHALINTHTMLGYFHGLQKSPVHLRLLNPADWKIGTPLSWEGDVLVADNFDHSVDSPILLGKLTKAETTVAGTKVEIYTYSQNDKISSDRLLESMKGMLESAKEFLIELPVDRYTFLYHFETTAREFNGAWEHSYSSEYTLPERTYDGPGELRDITDMASHEFFHIVTPLNIHSGIIETFNFVTPTPSVHLWLYEGVTEWNSGISQYRTGHMGFEDYVDTYIAQKVIVDNYFDKSWSLKKLADESFTPSGAKQYGNIYFRGSLVATLLDIKLLELSQGKYGLRELLLDLIEKYGKGKPVSEETFFDDIAAMTYPEVRGFFDRYVLDSQELPLKEYLAKIGLSYEVKSEREVTIKKMEMMTDSQKRLFEAWQKNLPR